MKPLLEALINKSNIKNAKSSKHRMFAICPYYPDEDKCRSMGLQLILDASTYNWYLLEIKDLRQIKIESIRTCVISYGYTPNDIITYIKQHYNDELIKNALSIKEIDDLCR